MTYLWTSLSLELEGCSSLEFQYMFIYVLAINLQNLVSFGRLFPEIFMHKVHGPIITKFKIFFKKWIWTLTLWRKTSQIKVACFPGGCSSIVSMTDVVEQYCLLCTYKLIWYQCISSRSCIWNSTPTKRINFFAWPSKNTSSTRGIRVVI